MNEEFNPYTGQYYSRQPETDSQETAEQNTPQYYPRQGYPQQGYQQQGYPYPPQYTNADRLRPMPRTGNAAKVFGVVSLVIGCFSLMIASMIFFNFRSSVTVKYAQAMISSLVVALPGVIFGIVSLMKKTEKKIFAILGIVFSSILMLSAFITYFFMVNTVQ